MSFCDSPITRRGLLAGAGKGSNLIGAAGRMCVDQDNRSSNRQRIRCAERVGKRADFILVRRTDLNMAPLGNVHSAMACAATPANVDTVVCEVKVLKRHGHLLQVDARQVVMAAEMSLKDLRRRAGPDWQPKAVWSLDGEFAKLAGCA